MLIFSSGCIGYPPRLDQTRWTPNQRLNYQMAEQLSREFGVNFTYRDPFFRIRRNRLFGIYRSPVNIRRRR